MDWISLLALIFSLLFIGLIAGIEVAFVSVNKLSIELSRKQGKASGKTWGRFSDKPSRFIGTVVLAFNLVLVIYGLLVGDLLAPVWNWIEPRLHSSAADYLKYIRLLIETILSTGILMLVLFTAKAVFRARNKQMMQSGIISSIAETLYSLFAGISGLFFKAAEWMLRYIFNVKVNERTEAFSKLHLEQFLQQSMGKEEEETSELNKELFENALSLSEVKLRECLIPRKEIVSMEHTVSLSELKDKFIETKLSKIVIYDKSIDNIIGYVHHLDMFREPQSLQGILHPIPTVPESMSATDLMNKFSKERKTIAWVVDEFGGTAGIVTMEDLLEEIFGEIQDEYDVADQLIDKQISATEFIFSGRLKLDTLAEKYDLQFPRKEEDPETLSGYIIQKNGSIPRLKERIIIGNFEFDVLNVSGTRIETVKLKILI
ncbi:MAG: HlyC/CorC family transporter [Chitinophagaceae bacterium]|nr:MAG: HlyC/CorC family transporter [Chitinophagaceae bacterium]